MVMAEGCERNDLSLRLWLMSFFGSMSATTLCWYCKKFISYTVSETDVPILPCDALSEILLDTSIQAVPHTAHRAIGYIYIFLTNPYYYA